jgi:hypothetical protein
MLQAVPVGSAGIGGDDCGADGDVDGSDVADGDGCGVDGLLDGFGELEVDAVGDGCGVGFVDWWRSWTPRRPNATVATRLTRSRAMMVRL